jgi:hypothetical protein
MNGDRLPGDLRRRDVEGQGPVQDTVLIWALCPLLRSSSGRRPADRSELGGVEASAADQRAVDVRLG